MSDIGQGNFIFGAILLCFLIYVTLRGQLGAYISVLV